MGWLLLAWQASIKVEGGPEPKALRNQDISLEDDKTVMQLNKPQRYCPLSIVRPMAGIRFDLIYPLVYSFTHLHLVVYQKDN